jgi:hypothetical protein
MEGINTGTIFNTIHYHFTKLPENLPSQHSESSDYRFLVTANFGGIKNLRLTNIAALMFPLRCFNPNERRRDFSAQLNWKNRSK